MKSEEWRVIPGLEGLYEASSFGRIRSISRVVTNHARGSKRLAPSKVLSPALNNQGRLRVSLSLHGTMRGFGVSRLVCLAFVGPMPFPGALCRHLDGVCSNNVPDNLAWGTHLDNSADAKRHGTNPAGERNPKAKLTDAEVSDIWRHRQLTGESAAIIAKRLGRPLGTIASIIDGITWTHITKGAEQCA